jgi:hypothetical protein
MDLLKAMREMMEENYAKAEANREASQAKADADRIADKEERREELERQIGSIASKMDAIDNILKAFHKNAQAYNSSTMQGKRSMKGRHRHK